MFTRFNRVDVCQLFAFGSRERSSEGLIAIATRIHIHIHIHIYGIWDMETL